MQGAIGIAYRRHNIQGLHHGAGFGAAAVGVEEAVAQGAGFVGVNIRAHNLATNQVVVAVFSYNINAITPGRALNNRHIIGTHDGDVDAVGSTTGGTAVAHDAEFGVGCAVLVRNRGQE